MTSSHQSSEQMEDTIKIQNAALQQAAAWFREYAVLHFQKKTKEADLKAEINCARAQYLETISKFPLDTNLRPQISISIEGGFVCGVVSDREIDLLVVDYDIDGAEDAELVAVPQDQGGTVNAFVTTWDGHIDPEWIQRAMNALAEHEAGQEPEDA